MTMKKKEKILLDITNDKCPITFVKTKIALEKLKSNQYLNVHIKNKPLKIMHITNFNERFNGRLHYNTGRRFNNGKLQ